MSEPITTTIIIIIIIISGSESCNAEVQTYLEEATRTRLSLEDGVVHCLVVHLQRDLQATRPTADDAVLGRAMVALVRTFRLHAHVREDDDERRYDEQSDWR